MFNTDILYMFQVYQLFMMQFSHFFGGYTKLWP